VGVRTLFFGSGPAALPALERLPSSDALELVAVVTTPARPAGRGKAMTPTPVAALAEVADLPIRTPATLRDEQVLRELRALDPELIVLADYGRIIPPAVLELPRHGALNIHPSLLPRHRGAAPVVGAILAGDPVTGVTLMRMDEGLDTGPILAQAGVALVGDEITPELEARLAELGADLLMASLPGWLAGSLEARPQPDEGVTLTRPLRRSDGWLDPARGAVELERQVRAYQPWPGSFLEHDGSRLKVWAATVSEPPADPSGSEPGDVVPTGDTLGLVTSAGVLRLEEVQPAGRLRMSGAAYRRGKRG
jgi:methionyl-tRNA formyltransferase